MLSYWIFIILFSLLFWVPQVFFAEPQHNPKAMQRAMSLRFEKQKFLDEVPFDRVILYALIAIERNYQFKKRFLPRVHEDDYYTLILNTAKRLAIADSGRVELPGLKQAAKPDTTKEE